MEYYSAIKNNKIMPFTVTWMDPEIVILSEVKSEKGKYHDIAYTWSLKNDTNKPIYKTERLADTENKLMVTKGK